MKKYAQRLIVSLKEYNFTYLILLILFSLPAIYFLSHPGFFKSDDGEWMIIRSNAFYQAFMDGQIPTRFLHRLDFGYGYPVSNFVYPGLLYISVPLQLLGFGSVDSIKIILALSLIGSSLFCFYWLSCIFNKKSSFAGALFYLYAPYHLFDTYIRGSVGEVLALLIVPFILYMNERKNLFFFSIGIFLLIISHNILAFLFLPLIFIYTVIRKTLSYKEILLGFLFGILMSTFFTIPALYELKYTIFAQTKISDFNKYFSSYELIGALTFLIIIIGIVLIIKKGIRNSIIEIFFLAICILSLFLSSSFSSIIWSISPSGLVQFPFRFLSISILASAFLLAFIIHQIKDKNFQLIAIVLILFSIILIAFPFLKPKEFIDKGEEYYLTNEASTTVSDEYTPRWVKERPVNHFENKVEVVYGESKIESLIYDNRNISFNVVANSESKVRINIIYYPGFMLKVNNKITNIEYENQKGVVEFKLPKGNHMIQYSFGETPLRLFADLLSIVSFIILLSYCFYNYYYVNKRSYK